MTAHSATLVFGFFENWWEKICMKKKIKPYGENTQTPHRLEISFSSHFYWEKTISYQFLVSLYKVTFKLEFKKS